MSSRPPESPSEAERVERAPDLDGLDKLLDHRVRLALCVLLSRHETLAFRRLKELTGETDGSLGAHLRRLEDASYLAVKKEFQGRRPISWYSLTGGGRSALSAHVNGLRALLGQARTE